MFRFSFKALLMLTVLTLWSAASAHCTLEAIGLWSSHASTSTGCCAPGDGCSDDACGVVESADITKPTCDLRIDAPTLTAEFCLLCACDLRSWSPQLEPNALPPRNPGDFTDWLPSRHIERRAAPPARAPDEVA
jgi:hypothetical protein